MTTIEQEVTAYVKRNAHRLTDLLVELIRIPSENKPPTGSEARCQAFLANRLRRAGIEPEIYALGETSGLEGHPLYFPGRDYTARPNLGARRRGTGAGRSLLLSGHIDTVPKGTLPWKRDPFGGEIEGNRLYGRGSNDMKAGVASNLFVFEALADLGVRLRGDLLFETIVDEEFGGGNGTLAGRLKGYNADAAVISEPTFLRVCLAQRGGRTAQITFRAPGGVLVQGRYPGGVVDQLRCFLNAVPEFAAQRRAGVTLHEAYQGSVDPVPVSITKVFTGPWGAAEPIGTPEECRVEFYWQLMPGEKQPDVDREFFEWLGALAARSPELFPEPPTVEFPVRWLPGSAISPECPLVTELAAAARSVMGVAPAVEGIEGPCDLYILQEHFGIPAVLWGARGGNTHGADEYVEIDSLVTATQVLLLFVCNWCGGN